MHVAVFSPFVLWPTHFATDLEIIQRHLDEGDSVTMLVCDGELSSCDVNPGHEPDRCVVCRDTRSTGVRRLSGSPAVEPLSRFETPWPLVGDLQRRFERRDELRQYRIEAFDIGNAVLSSLISFSRDAAVDVKTHQRLLAKLMGAASNVYRWTDQFLQQHHVDRVYVFNTRFASTRGVLRACQKHGVECLTHERGHDLQHFELYPNTFPHDRELIDRCIREAWESADPATRREIGAQWYREKAVGIEKYQNSFVAHQSPGLLPRNWDASQRNVVIFTSSEDEFAAVGAGWENPLYKSEIAGLQTIVASLCATPHNLQIYVRVHPNLAGLENRQTQGLRELKAPFLTIIPAESDISSYALLTNAVTVLTFGSTVGIEAVFWGAPSILAGMSWYRELGATYNPATHDETIALLTATLAPMNVEPALMYGYYFSTYGIPFKYVQATSYDVATFVGRMGRADSRP